MVRRISQGTTACGEVSRFFLTSINRFTYGVAITPRFVSKYFLLYIKEIFYIIKEYILRYFYFYAWIYEVQLHSKASFSVKFMAES